MNAILATEQRLVALADAPNLRAGNAAPPVSARIRARLQRAKRRFHANDNISPFVAPGEMEELLDEVESKMKEVLQSLVIDTGSDHNTQDTARRVAKMYLTEVFRGRYEPEPSVTKFPNAERLNELMIVGPITVRSVSVRRRHIAGRC